MRQGILIAVVVAVAVAWTARADDTEQLMRRNACMSCHAVDHKVIGPSYADVAKRYRSDPAAVARLTKKIKEGGGGVWGTAGMPPHPKLSDEELKAMVAWILAH